MKQLGNSVAIDAVKAYAKELIDYMHQLDNNNRQNTPEIKKNKGEWSELYTFLKLILDKKIYFSDSLLNTKDEFVQINQITNLNINETVKILSNGNYEVYDQNNKKLHHSTFSEKRFTSCKKQNYWWERKYF